MKWFVKYGYSDSLEVEPILQTFYAGRSHLIALFAYEWCKLFYTKGVHTTIKMYNETDSGEVSNERS